MAESSYRLVMRTGPNPGQTFDLLQPEITIGRDINNTIVINDAEISRKHAHVYIQGGFYQIEDTGSTNGTFVNGQRLMGPHLLRPGEVIFLGETVSLAYEFSQFDPNATVASVPRGVPEPAIPAAQPAPQPVVNYPPPAYTPPAPPAPVYTGQVPPGPGEPVYEEEYEEKQTNRTRWVVGVGCLLVLVCIVGVGLLAFDTLNLYCVSPFDSLSGLFYSCP
ncbi:MAG TPA: FHA domain-containing protein [Anaerolineales bacterium]|nr:FHA domain-containing protein [Anaerolineales bacterium]